MLGEDVDQVVERPTEERENVEAMQAMAPGVRDREVDPSDLFSRDTEPAGQDPPGRSVDVSVFLLNLERVVAQALPRSDDRPLLGQMHGECGVGFEVRFGRHRQGREQVLAAEERPAVGDGRVFARSVAVVIDPHVVAELPSALRNPPDQSSLFHLDLAGSGEIDVPTGVDSKAQDAGQTLAVESDRDAGEPVSGEQKDVVADVECGGGGSGARGGEKKQAQERGRKSAGGSDHSSRSVYSVCSRSATSGRGSPGPAGSG